MQNEQYSLVPYRHWWSSLDISSNHAFVASNHFTPQVQPTRNALSTRDKHAIAPQAPVASTLDFCPPPTTCQPTRLLNPARILLCYSYKHTSPALHYMPETIPRSTARHNKIAPIASSKRTQVVRTQCSAPTYLSLASVPFGVTPSLTAANRLRT